MEKLKLPVIKVSAPETKWLLMDEYLRFVNFNLKYTSHIKAHRHWKKLLAVNAPLSLK